MLLEVFSNLFMSVAEQMGVRLQSTAHSVNIKERLDFSCAIFDADGGLIANAPHIPVHLGSMGESIKMVMARNTGRYEARRRLRPQRPLPRRHPPPGHHGGHPRLRPGRHRHLVLRGIPRPSCRDRGDFAWVDAGVQHAGRGRGRADRQLAARRGRPAARTGDHRSAGQRRVSLARPGNQPRRPARADRGQREGHRGTPPDGGPLRARRRARVHAARPGERGRGGPGGDHRAQRRRVRLRARQRRAHPGTGHRRPGCQDGHDRLHRHVAAAGRQLQRALQRGDGGGALRVPHPGRQGHPAQRRLPGAAGGDHPARDDAVAAVPGGGRRRQRGDESGGDRRPVRRAEGHGGGLRDDEQRDVRQRPVPVLRDGRQWLRSGPGVRRHRCGADEDDELAANRPGGARVALPGPARVLRDPRGQRRGRTVARRRRRGQAATVPRADDRDDAGRSPPGARVRPGWRRSGGARQALGGARGRFSDSAARVRHRGA